MAKKFLKNKNQDKKIKYKKRNSYNNEKKFRKNYNKRIPKKGNKFPFKSKSFFKKGDKNGINEKEQIKNAEIINIEEINNQSEEKGKENDKNELKVENNKNNQNKEIKIEKNKENKDDSQKDEKNEIKREKNNKEQINNDMKEIFIRNIGYSTTEEKLKDLFIQLIPENSIEFCLLCKDKDTQNSKGSAFIKLTKKSYDKVMSLYKEYSSKKSNFDEMNPFELEGRYLKLFDAISKEELKNLEKEKEKKNSKRNKTYLYYGLSKETISKLKEFQNITEKDKEKRERLIQIKKENFYNNPNFHVSETRLSFRNFDKNIDENNLKEKINEVLEKDKKIQNEYKNKKLIKQIKLLRENDDKSKCVAFVECLNFDVAKFLIDNLSGITLNEKSEKGLIIDFSLDDFRKKLSRERKLERIKDIKKQIKKEKREKRRNGKKEDSGLNNTNKIGLKDINDINKLIDLYHTTMSRGKKQRIKKKLKNLGYNKDIPPVEINQNKNSINLKEENDNKMNSNDDYVKIKISNNRTELNKKMKNKIKQNKKENNKNDKNKDFINKKRERDNKGFGEDENIQRKKKKKQNKELNITKNIINERMDYINKNKNNKNFDNDDDNDPDMQKYYDKIEQQLSKNK
jgi:hypothetical protein